MAKLPMAFQGHPKTWAEEQVQGASLIIYKTRTHGIILRQGKEKPLSKKGRWEWFTNWANSCLTSLSCDSVICIVPHVHTTESKLRPIELHRKVFRFFPPPLMATSETWPEVDFNKSCKPHIFEFYKFDAVPCAGFATLSAENILSKSWPSQYKLTGQKSTRLWKLTSNKSQPRPNQVICLDPPLVVESQRARFWSLS